MSACAGLRSGLASIRLVPFPSRDAREQPAAPCALSLAIVQVGNASGFTVACGKRKTRLLSALGFDPSDVETVAPSERPIHHGCPAGCLISFTPVMRLSVFDACAGAAAVSSSATTNATRSRESLTARHPRSEERRVGKECASRAA